MVQCILLKKETVDAAFHGDRKNFSLISSFKKYEIMNISEGQSVNLFFNDEILR